jgi:hypothetical protein
MSDEQADAYEHAWQLAADLRRWTERLNAGIAALEREAALLGYPPRSTVVSLFVENGRKRRDCILAWDGRRLLWNRQPLLSASRDARCAAVSHLDEVIRR